MLRSQNAASSLEVSGHTKVLILDDIARPGSFGSSNFTVYHGSHKYLYVKGVARVDEPIDQLLPNSAVSLSSMELYGFFQFIVFVIVSMSFCIR